jgi:hypothetical protein
MQRGLTAGAHACEIRTTVEDSDLLRGRPDGADILDGNAIIQVQAFKDLKGR